MLIKKLMTYLKSRLAILKIHLNFTIFILSKIFMVTIISVNIKQYYTVLYTVKIGQRFSRPQPGCHLPNSHWPGIIKLFPASESLVGDIPAGDRKSLVFLKCKLCTSSANHKIFPICN